MRFFILTLGILASFSSAFAYDHCSDVVADRAMGDLKRSRFNWDLKLLTHDQALSVFNSGKLAGRKYSLRGDPYGNTSREESNRYAARLLYKSPNVAFYAFEFTSTSNTNLMFLYAVRESDCHPITDIQYVQ